MGDAMSAPQYLILPDVAARTPWGNVLHKVVGIVPSAPNEYGEWLRERVRTACGRYEYPDDLVGTVESVTCSRCLAKL